MGLNDKIYTAEQEPSYWVRVGNQELTEVESIVIDRDFDQASGTCTITCPRKWSVEPNDPVEVEQGYAGYNRRTFTGYVDDVDKESFPKHMVIRARDVLKRAIDNFIVDEIQYASVQAENAVRDLLERSGIYNSSLDTTDFTVGDVEPAKFSLISAFDAIRSVADLIGWRCWAESDGTVVFRKVYPRGATTYRWLYKKAPTFGSESGIIHIDHTFSDIDLRNWIEVWGWTNPTTGVTIEAEAHADSPYVPDPPRYRKAVISSEIIDTQDMAQWIAERVLGDLNQLVNRLEATVQGNPRLHIGNTVRIVEDWTDLSSGANYFIYGISSEMRGDGLYQMSLDLRGGRYAVPAWPEGQDPIASFEVKQVGWGDPTWIVYVDASASYDPDGEIAGYDFDWGDGSTHGTQVVDNHQYSSGSVGQQFTITLTVTDDDSRTGTCSKVITLGSSGSGVGVYDRVLYFADGSGRGYGSPDSGNNWNYFATSGACNQVAVNSADKEGYAWFGDANGKLYKSADYCVTGTLVYTFGAAITALWLSRVDPDMLLVGLSDGKIYKTVDAGVTWSLIGEFEGPVYWVITRYGDANHILAAGGTTAGWLRLTTDGGTSWTDYASGWGVESIRDGCTHFQTHLGFACRTDPSPVRHTDDNLATFTSPTGVTDQNLSTITAEQKYDDQLKMVGGAGGLNAWLTTSGSTYSTSGSLISGTEVLKLLIDQELYGTVFGGTKDAGADLEISFDYGATWKQLFDAPGNVNDIAQGPLLPKVGKGYLWTYRQPNVYFSSTGGVSWVALDASGLSNFGTFLRIVGHPNDCRTAYMTSYDSSNTIIRIWKSTDGNMSWAQVGTISGNFEDARILAIDPIDPQIVWVGARIGWTLYIYKSINGGIDWTQKLSLDGNNKIVALACSPATPNRVIFAGGPSTAFGIWLSTNGGDNWTKVSTIALDTFEDLRRGALNFSPNGQNVVFRGGTDHPTTGNGSRVATSTDAGATWSWSAASTPRFENWNQDYPVKACVAPNGYTLYVLSLGNPPTNPTKFYRSDDFGASWAEKQPDVGIAYAIAHPMIIDVLYAIYAPASPSNHVFYKSIDNGETWEAIGNFGSSGYTFEDLTISGWQEIVV